MFVERDEEKVSESNSIMIETTSTFDSPCLKALKLRLLSFGDLGMTVNLHHTMPMRNWHFVTCLERLSYFVM